MYPRLIADIGASNARFALADEAGMLACRRTVPTRNHDSIVGTIEQYLAGLPVEPVAACLAIASPITGDRVRMTNHHWQFSVSELRSRFAWEHDDEVANEALEMFFALLGSACGDQALATGARGGVYLAGGIVPRMKERLMLSDFRRRFEDKPPMSDYMKAIATRLIIEEEPGLTGASHWPLTATPGNG